LREPSARAILAGGGRRAKTLDRPSLYDTDYVAWLGEQAAHLRAGRLDQLDLNVAEQLESLLSSERRELENRLDVLILHLLKWDHSRISDLIGGGRLFRNTGRASGAFSATARA
jgi:Domain of unknown function DUF29